MVMTVREWLRGIKWLHRLHTWYYRVLFRPAVEFLQCLLFCPVLRIRYGKQCRRIRKKSEGGRIRVLFPISNLAKWKMQSLFDLMAKTSGFEPVMALTIMDVENDLSDEDKRARIRQMEVYFGAKGMGYVVAYDTLAGAALSFRRFTPDIVFYQQPWLIAKCQEPIRVSRYALTCYVPYFVQNYGALDMDCLLVFHRMLWRYFILNESWAKEFMKAQGLLRSGKVLGAGHPMLDTLADTWADSPGDGCVIYAPHWSCRTGERYSTFLDNGREMLALAQRHPEVRWAFKPHPTLRKVLVTDGWMTQCEVDAYYDAWASIGETCYDGDYLQLFKNSKAMITDCASFLVEYACTGKPIIHLISSDVKYRPHPISEALFSSYYQARNWEGFEKHFERVVLGGDDFRREERLAKVRELRLRDNCAAHNIINYLESVFEGADD